MKQLLILSGKGGTGKTTIASAFIKISKAKAYADCDVDAPNLHLLLESKCDPQISDYYGMDKASINQEYCIECGLCMKSCRFDAIKFADRYDIDSNSCEGCGVCEEVCPVGAIHLAKDKAGDLILYKASEVFSSAKLKMGSGTSGLLVSNVKSNLKKNSESDFAIIDGSPGIGCPVIASISGVDLVLIVTEPSLSGISDMKRIFETASKFNTKSLVCINKFDTNVELSYKIEDLCKQNQIPFVGKISYDKSIVIGQNMGKGVLDIDSKASGEIKSIYDSVIEILNNKGEKENENSSSKQFGECSTALWTL